MTDENRKLQLLFWSGWHVVAIGVLASIGVLGAGVPPGQFGRSELFVIGTLVAGYVLGAAICHLDSWRRKTPDGLTAAVAGVAGYGPTLLALLLTEVEFSASIVTTSVAVGLLLLMGVFGLRRRRGMLLGIMTLVVGALWAVALETDVTFLASGWGGGLETRQIDTGLYSVEATFYRNRVPKSYSGIAGGGIARLRDEYVLATGDGDLYALRLGVRSGADSLVVESLGRAPLNRDEFREATGQTGYLHWFRVLDASIQPVGDRIRLLVSHHHWRPEDRCFVVRVSMVEGARGTSLRELTGRDWTAVHDTEPCLPLKEETSPSWPFRGMEGGGRMVGLDDRHLLLTVGDQGFNGYRFEPDYVQDRGTSYGKIVRVDLSDGSWELYSLGHRNPQGLLRDDDGTIWLTEHGPRGGDELNRIQEGAHYGWPEVTYGTDYGKHVWPLSRRQGQHDEYSGPVNAWVPAIGVSNLIRLQGGLFDLWKGDLLIGSLVAETLYRVHFDEGIVVVVEPIEVGERIRDLVQDDSGRIILWTDSYTVVVLEPTSMAFARCSGCHMVDDGTNHGLGPDLAGVLGRGIGSSEGFDYSAALEEMEGRWTGERLDRFLANPQAVAPGTSMRMEGIDDPEVRAAIIEYLRSRSRP